MVGLALAPRLVLALGGDIEDTVVPGHVDLAGVEPWHLDAQDELVVLLVQFGRYYRFRTVDSGIQCSVATNLPWLITLIPSESMFAVLYKPFYRDGFM